MLKTQLDKISVELNVGEALESDGYSLTHEEISTIVDLMYDAADMGHWSFGDYATFADDVANEWGDWMYVVRQYANLDDEEEEE